MQPYVGIAPLNLVYVSDLSKLDFLRKREEQAMTAGIDAGHCSQNVYLYGAAANIAVVVRTSIDKVSIGKCLHYYFYFIDEQLGLCYVRVPTWCPFRLQVYFNGHHWLANQLKQRAIGFESLDNAFVSIDDVDRANALAAQLDVDLLHAKLDQWAKRYCPVASELQLCYSWSLMQVEYFTDLIFESPACLQSFYPLLLEALIQAVKPEDIATFLGRTLRGNYQGEMGSQLQTRWFGTRIRHQMGPVAIKMYDEFGCLLRIETTVNDVSFLKQNRQVQHRDGSTSTQLAPMKKTLYSLPALQKRLLAANQRYLKFISEINTPDVGTKQLHKLAETKTQKHHRYKGFNLFSEEDSSLFRTFLRGEFCISGFTNGQLRQHLPHKSAGQMTRIIKRLRVHGLIRKVARRYKYYLTAFGRRVAAMALKLREMIVIPQLAQT